MGRGWLLRSCMLCIPHFRVEGSRVPHTELGAQSRLSLLPPPFDGEHPPSPDKLSWGGEKERWIHVPRLWYCYGVGGFADRTWSFSALGIGAADTCNNSWKNYPGWNRNLLKFKMELPWAIFLPAVGDSPSALSRVCCSHAQHVLPMGHRLLEAKQGGRAFFPGKDKFLPFQQKKLCLTLGYNILRHLWGFFHLNYKYLNRVVAPCFFTECFLWILQSCLEPLEGLNGVSLDKEPKLDSTCAREWRVSWSFWVWVLKKGQPCSLF